jgi:hypothetical protein
MNAARWPPMQAQGLGGMGEMGSAPRPQGRKSGLTIEHIVSQFQGELPNRRETDAGFMIYTIRSKGHWYVVLSFYYHLTP